MYKVGIIGDKESVLGFLALGMKAFPVTDGEAARRTLRGMMEAGFALVYITEEFYESVEDIIDKYSEYLTPAVIPIPSSKGSLGIGMNKLRKATIRAVGSDILRE